MDSGIRIDNAAPALPSTTSAYPALNPNLRLQAQPVQAPALKPQKIEKLETRDLFFSSQSARSHVERYLAERSAHRLSFRFEQDAAKGWMKRLLNNSNALLLVEKTPVRPAKSPKGKSTAAKAAAPAERLAVRLLEFEEISRTPLLQKALVAVSSEPYKVQRFAFVPKTGELHPEASFKAHGIERQDRPNWQKMMGWLRDKLPYQAEQKLPMGVDEDLSLRLGRRLRFTPTEQWRDRDGNPVQVMDLMRLDNARLAQVVNVREQAELEKTGALSLERAETKKSWRDKILGYIESVEQRGYFLQPDHIEQTRHTRRKVAAPPKSLPDKPDAVAVTSNVRVIKPEETNPFAEVAFAGLVSAPVVEKSVTQKPDLIASPVTKKPASAKATAKKPPLPSTQPTFKSNPFKAGPLQSKPTDKA